LGKAKTRHVKSHHKEVKIRRDCHEELRRPASREGFERANPHRGAVQTPYWPQYGSLYWPQYG
jgi:hypothetical protein